MSVVTNPKRGRKTGQIFFEFKALGAAGLRKKHAPATTFYEAGFAANNATSGRPVTNVCVAANVIFGVVLGARLVDQ